MNWSKKQIQWYGFLIAVLGILLGISATLSIQNILNL